MHITLVSGATATSAAPSASTDGVDIRNGATSGSAGAYAVGLRDSDWATCLVRSTAGSGAMDVTVKLWGMHVEESGTAIWYPLGSNATDSLRGVLNQGNAIGEVSADSIRHSEIVQGLSSFRRIYAQITAINGTSTAITVKLIRA